ncbi:MAG: glycosyltransferase [Planctomycetota bacterium]
MPSQRKVSIVVPVRDGATHIEDRVRLVRTQLKSMTDDPIEILVVDDGSRDGTVDVLRELADELTEVRLVRHSRPRGMESAGQSGLERATGSLVFVQESEEPMSLADLRRLFRISDDESVVAARAESRPQPVAAPLLRRLRAWGTDAGKQLQWQADRPHYSSVQMLRRSHLQRLSGKDSSRYRLEGQTIHETMITQQTQVQQAADRLTHHYST